MSAEAPATLIVFLQELVNGLAKEGPRAISSERAIVEARRKYGDMDAADLADALSEIIDDWNAEASYERETFGEPEDTPCIENCDDWGTGEGRFHGRI